MKQNDRHKNNYLLHGKPMPSSPSPFPSPPSLHTPLSHFLWPLGYSYIYLS